MTRLVIGARFGPPLVLSAGAAAAVPGEKLAELGVAGGAVHDALVALAAVEHGHALASRDERARATYDLVGVQVVPALS